MASSKAFHQIKEPGFQVYNPRNPGTHVEIDNIGVKGTTLFIFEGSKGEPNISQLKERFFLFSNILIKNQLIADNALLNYAEVRVFYYNLKTNTVAEYAKNGTRKETWKYDNRRTKLKDVLRNL